MRVYASVCNDACRSHVPKQVNPSLGTMDYLSKFSSIRVTMNPCIPRVNYNYQPLIVDAR